METNTTNSTQGERALDGAIKEAQLADLNKIIVNLTAKRVAISQKSETALAEDFLLENKCPRPLDVPIQSQNPFTPNNLDRLDIVGEAIQLIPDGPIKNQVYFLFNLANEAALAIGQAEQQALLWRSKADAFLLEIIKETWVKRQLRQTGGDLRRQF